MNNAKKKQRLNKTIKSAYKTHFSMKSKNVYDQEKKVYTLVGVHTLVLSASAAGNPSPLGKYLSLCSPLEIPFGHSRPRHALCTVSLLIVSVTPDTILSVYYRNANR